MTILSYLRLHQFRNYTSEEVDLGPGMHVFVGPNGQGKTNLLESIYYLSLLRSFRTKRVRSLRQWQRESFYLEGKLLSQDSEASRKRVDDIDVLYGDRRRLRINGTLIPRASSFINRFLCLAFAPEDIRLVKGSAGERRRFLNILLSQMDSVYMHHLQRFAEAVRDRNAILKEERRYGVSALRAYDGLLIEHGAYLAAARARFVRVFSEESRELFCRLTDNEVGNLGLAYRTRLAKTGAENEDQTSLAASYARRLAEALPRDREEKRTTCGPHRDDICLTLDDRLAGVYGSEGQCRLVALTLRLASVALLKTVHSPSRGLILLVDDVLGELDNRRREAFFSVLDGAQQIMIATTELEPLLKQRAERVYQIEHGAIRPR